MPLAIRGLTGVGASPSGTRDRECESVTTCVTERGVTNGHWRPRRLFSRCVLECWALAVTFSRSHSPHHTPPPQKNGVTPTCFSGGLELPGPGSGLFLCLFFSKKCFFSPGESPGPARTGPGPKKKSKNISRTPGPAGWPGRPAVYGISVLRVQWISR